MKIKMFRKSNLRKDEMEELLQGRLYCIAFIAPGSTCRWTGPIRFTIDTGADTCVIPRKFLVQMGLGNLPIVDQSETEMADGSVSMEDTALIDLKLTCQNGDNSVLINLPVSIMDSGEEPLLGLNVLSFYRLEITGGKLTVLQPLPEQFDALDDFEPSITTFERVAGGIRRINAESNVNDRDNSATPLKPIERPKLPEPQQGPKLSQPPKIPVPPDPPTPPKPPT